MTLTAKGPTITVVLNGEVVNEIDLANWKDGKLNPDASEMPKWSRASRGVKCPEKAALASKVAMRGQASSFAR